MSQPLDGIRVVDMTHDWAGPHATRMVADYGAEVIKIEYPPRLCGMRGAYEERFDLHPRWWEINRNKATISLDLHQAEHRDAFIKLVETADIVVENSRPGVMEEWGLGYDRLREAKSDIIVVAMSAYGTGGPESHYAGYGGAIEALSGVQSLTRYERDGDAMRVRELDVTNGLMGACAIMTALLHRRQTGEGQFVELSQCEASGWMIGDRLLAHAANASERETFGNRHAEFAPQGCYPCEGSEHWVVITIRDDDEWQAFCRAVDKPEWGEDARFSDVEARHLHHDAIDELIAGVTCSRDRHELVDCLQAAGVVAGFVANPEDLANDPHLVQRDWLFQLEGPEAHRYPGVPFRFARGGGHFKRRGPALGEDNEAILCEELGLPKSILDSIDSLDVGTAYDIE